MRVRFSARVCVRVRVNSFRDSFSVLLSTQHLLHVNDSREKLHVHKILTLICNIVLSQHKQ